MAGRKRNDGIDFYQTPTWGVEKPKNSGTIAYAWYVWEKGYTGKPQIDWLI